MSQSPSSSTIQGEVIFFRNFEKMRAKYVEVNIDLILQIEMNGYDSAHDFKQKIADERFGFWFPACPSIWSSVTSGRCTLRAASLVAFRGEFGYQHIHQLLGGYGELNYDPSIFRDELFNVIITGPSEQIAQVPKVRSWTIPSFILQKVVWNFFSVITTGRIHQAAFV